MITLPKTREDTTQGVLFTAKCREDMSPRGGGTIEARAWPKFCPVRHALYPTGGAYNFPPDSLA